MIHPDPIIRRIHACALASVACLLHGGPGTGKTARYDAYVKLRNAHGERTLLSRQEPIDAKPRFIVDGRMVVTDPPEWERIERAKAAGIFTIFFADELNRATREVEGAWLDRFDRSSGTFILAAVNPPSRGQSARSLESATSNRFCHLDVPADCLAYAGALLSGWPAETPGSLPEPDVKTIDRESVTARAIGSGFIRHRGNDVLSREPQDPVQAGRAWPSPRSWDMALRLYAVARALELDADDVVALVGGCVGPGVAVEFIQYATDAEVDPEELLKDPPAWVPPVGRVDKTIGACGMVLAAVSRQLTDERWQAAWALAGRCCDAGQIDAGIFFSNALLATEGQKSTEPGKKVKLTHSSVLMRTHAPRIAKLLAPARVTK